jgi:hypothetical protein
VNEIESRKIQNTDWLTPGRYSVRSISTVRRIGCAGRRDGGWEGVVGLGLMEWGRRRQTQTQSHRVSERVMLSKCKRKGQNVECRVGSGEGRECNVRRKRRARRARK